MPNAKFKRTIINPYAVSKPVSEKPKISDSELDVLVENPNAFFADANKRGKFFGMETHELKDTLSDYTNRKGVDSAAIITSIITDIDW